MKWIVLLFCSVGFAEELDNPWQANAQVGDTYKGAVVDHVYDGTVGSYRFVKWIGEPQDNTVSGYFDFGKMRLQWGREIIATNNVQNISFPAPFKPGKTPMVNVSTETDLGVSVFGGNLLQLTALGFDFDLNDLILLTSNPVVNWFAVGEKP